MRSWMQCSRSETIVKLTTTILELHLRHTFTIARGSRDIEPCVIAELEHDGIVGFGEAAPSERYGETPESVLEFLGRVDLSRFTDPMDIGSIISYLNTIAPGNFAAKAAIDIAAHDWIGKKLNVPLWKLWGLDKHLTPKTSFTIGIDSIDIIRKKVREAAPYPILKVKVGIPDDEKIIKAIRDETDKVIRVDANEGWKDRNQALDKILWLESQGIEFIEQPMPDAQLDDIAWLRERVHIPLIADESVKTLADIPRISHAFDGINIKLMKSTGLREAMRMIHTAQAMNMKIMLGCMIETSVAITAAAHLSPLVDYADLDGHVLITDDPFKGVEIIGGKLLLNDAPGLGLQKRM